jgi:hypothetical protein
MPEYQYLRWGKASELDYKALNAMALNDELIRDIIEQAPRGALLWKRIDSATLTSTAFNSIEGFDALKFDVESNRHIRIQLYPFTANSSLVSAKLQINLVIDGVYSYGKTSTLGSAEEDVISENVYYSSALSAGTHTVSVKYKITTATTTNITLPSGALLLIEDLGKNVDA